MSRAAFACLWGFVFVLPWEDVIRLPLLGSIPRLVALVALVVGGLFIVARGRVRPPAAFQLLALAFVLWAGLSGLWSIDADATRERFLTYLQLVVLVWLLWEIAWSPERQRALLQAYVLGACIAALAILQNYRAGISLAEAERFTGLNANPNDLGLTLVLGLPMAWYLGLSAPSRRFAWVWHLYLPLAVTATLLTASRGAFVAALAALLIIPWTWGQLRLRAQVAVCAFGLASVVVAVGAVPDASLARLATTRSDIESGHFGGRGVIWESGLQVVRAHPIVGVGAGAFGAAVEPTLRNRWSSHETFLAILAEEGIVGLALFLAMVGAALTRLRPLSVLERRFSIVLLVALAAASLTGQWDYHKQLWFVLGLVAAQGALRVAATTGAHTGRRSVTQSRRPEPAVAMGRPW